MKNRFKGKKFAVMGLDGAGRGIKDVRYLLQNRAGVIGTDLKSEEELPEAVALAKKFSNLKLILGKHRLGDFKHRDFVIRAALAPLDSPYLAEARRNGIPIVSDETFFLLNAPKIFTIGVTGTRGKTTVTHMVAEILTETGRRVFLGGNVQDMALLPLLGEVCDGDVVVMELDSWKLQSFAENKISPQIAIFTTFFPDHLNYYKGDLERYWEDKSAIFKNQRPGDVLIVSQQVAGTMKKQGYKLAQKFIIAQKLPPEWSLKVLGAHNRQNAGLALDVARKIGVSDEVSRRALEGFKGVPGRLECIGEHRGIKFYNDTTATTPEGVMAALRSFPKYKKKIVLIAGGSDKGLMYDGMMGVVVEYCRALVLLPGTATEKISKSEYLNPKQIPTTKAQDMKEAMEEAMNVAAPDDIIILSPGAASFGIFKNEYDRGDQFTTLFKRLE